jgi:ABC-type polysaccharide/polyol phosphate export permease
MDFSDAISELTGVVSSFAQSQPLITVFILLVIAFFTYRKPVFFVSVLTLGLIVAGTFYFIMSMSNPGVSKKGELIKKSVPENLSRPSGIH